ncbi:ThiF family adenylyltransferase [Vibrio parahaemolyticus]|uniref:ThiF family adenylyltransferase n=1 Tax=Vibrio parahaemolyticus TaxID=670 RepID=UPI0003F4BC31|nr:ThiF family adenylyltransferase [Vibrio parahaemolyticus]
MSCNHYKLVISSMHHQQLREHLFPGDGLEAAAILLCSKSSKRRLLVSKLILIEHQACALRLPDKITWPGKCVEEAIDIADAEGLSVILMHSHPGGVFNFSECDDQSDQQVIPSLFEGISSSTACHGSAIMTPDGAVKARLYKKDLDFEYVESVSCASEDLSIWRAGENLPTHPLAFSSDMGKDLSFLTACIVGVSGTGSIIAEQLARMGIGGLVLIDFDRTEFKNLNRILNSTREDASNGRYKTRMFADRVKLYREDIRIECVESSINSREAVEAAGTADVLFCCVDSSEGRYVCDMISSAFLMPLLDVGVTIPTRKTPGGGTAIADVYGRIDYVFPGAPSLFDRQVYTSESLRKEYINAVDPDDHNQQVAEGYLKGVVEEAPDVIALNMRAASACVMEFIMRRYPFRHEPNSMFSRTVFSLASCEEEYESDSSFECTQSPNMGIGLEEPLLGIPGLAKSSTSLRRTA